jgi:septum formation protein
LSGRGFDLPQALNKSKWASRHTSGTRAACHNSIMLVLASASPRRSELLTQAGYQFQVHPAHISEDPLPGEDPIAYVTRLAREKAEAVYLELTRKLTASDSQELSRDSESELAVLGADTTVTLDNMILGKPADAADAARMLRLLSGRTHRVITGVAVVTAESVEVAAEVTAVRFLTLSDAEIADYVASGEPMDKAGAYAIQGRAARWIPRIEGCYFNVVGLPLALVSAMLELCNFKK